MSHAWVEFTSGNPFTHLERGHLNDRYFTNSYNITPLDLLSFLQVGATKIYRQTYTPTLNIGTVLCRRCNSLADSFIVLAKCIPFELELVGTFPWGTQGRLMDPGHMGEGMGWVIPPPVRSVELPLFWKPMNGPDTLQVATVSVTTVILPLWLVE